jgi:hypothetical protein
MHFYKTATLVDAALPALLGLTVLMGLLDFYF